MSQVKKFWMNTVSDRVLEFPLPDPAAIDPEDMAHSLGMLCRFGGHILWHYSVAEHSVHVSRLVERRLRTMVAAYAEQYPHLGPLFSEEAIRLLSLAGLVHDGSEYMLADVISPVKQYWRSREMHEYTDLELGIMESISSRFGLPAGLWHDPLVKEADNLMYATESAQLRVVTLATPPTGNPQNEPLPGYDLGLERGAAKAAWLRRFREVCR